ncbi:MAG: hypothetical protein U9R51_08200 [Actinomycetota bacterium]|nr:hypothetical protein [Actinomycetota bacterium]
MEHPASAHIHKTGFVTRVTITAVVAALLASLATAVLIAAMSGPSEATPSGEVDPAAVNGLDRLP